MTPVGEPRVQSTVSTILRRGPCRRRAARLRSDHLSEATRGYFDQQALRAIPRVTNAIERGDLPPDCDADALLTAFRAPLFYRMITTGDPIDEDLIKRSTRVALTAARAGLLSA